MLSVKTELLEALAASLEKLSPGSGAKAAFESPKVAAHGDLATTAAMQLANPLKLNPLKDLVRAHLGTAAHGAGAERLFGAAARGQAAGETVLPPAARRR